MSSLANFEEKSSICLFLRRYLDDVFSQTSLGKRFFQLVTAVHDLVLGFSVCGPVTTGHVHVTRKRTKIKK